jgi:hypothetical protein
MKRIQKQKQKKNQEQKQKQREVNIVDDESDDEKFDSDKSFVSQIYYKRSSLL